MKVDLAYADSSNQIWLNLDVPEEATIEEVIEQSGILVKVSDIDLKKQKVGIFGKVTKLSATVSEGDRIEIYKPIIRTFDDEDDDDDD